jgi:hypothetical protein
MLTGIGWFIREEGWIRQKDWFRGWRNGWGVELLLMGYRKLTLPIYDENHKSPASKWGRGIGGEDNI